MSSEIDYLKRICKVLKTPVGKLSINQNKAVVQTCGTNIITGFVSIILYALKQSNTSLKNENTLEDIEIRQWLEYSITTLKNLKRYTKEILEELDAILQSRTYLVNYRLTIVDIVIYYFLQNTMVKLGNKFLRCALGPQEKVQYLNVSRWYDNIQQNIEVRQDLPLVNFNTNYVLSTIIMSH